MEMEPEPRELAVVEDEVAASEEVRRKDQEPWEWAAVVVDEVVVSGEDHKMETGPKEQVLTLFPNPQCHFPSPEAEKAPTAACSDSHPPGDPCPGGRHPRGRPPPRAGPPEAGNSAGR